MSSPVTAAELEEICLDAVAALGVTGAQAAVVSGDEIVEAAVGIANRDLGTAMTRDTIIQIGSTTKVYTAVLVLQLVDRGLIDLDRPVATYLPGVRLAAGERWREITPRHLLSMTSGLDNGPYRDTGTGEDAVARYVGSLGDLPLHFEPGSAYGYSNASTAVSGRMIEAVTGQTWDAVLAESLLGPAAMRDSETLFTRLPYHRVAVGHFPGETGVFPTWTFGRGLGPAGTTLATTAADLARFGRVLLGRGVAGNGARILSADAVELIETPHVAVPSKAYADDWCLGPYRRRWGATDVWGHGGTTRNGSSTLVWIPSHDVAVATIVNTPPRGYPFADRVLDAVVRDRLGVVKPHRPRIDDSIPVDPAKYVGRYASWGFDYEMTAEDGHLVATMRSRMTGDSPDEGWRDPIRTVLRPIAPDRFYPDDDALTWDHTWDVAFGTDRSGRAALFHNGSFTAPRVG